MAWYKIIGFCSEGYELVNREADTLKEAKAELRRIAKDKEYISSGLAKVEIRNYRDECIVDKFI